MANPPDCAMCNKKATKTCVSCRCTIYCSKECQLKDWKIHKILCKSFSSFETPPNPSLRRAIVLHENGQIKFSWEKVEKAELEGNKFDMPQGLEKYFGSKQLGQEVFGENPIRGRPQQETLSIMLIDNFLSDGSPKNMAVSRLVPEMTEGVKTWRGALVAFKHVGGWMDAVKTVENPYPAIGHMDMGDFRGVIDYLTNWKKEVDLPKEVKEKRTRERLTKLYGPEAAAQWTVLNL